MGWRFTEDVEQYADHTWRLLARRPVANTLALTVIVRVRAGSRWSDAPMLFGWYESGSAVTGAVCMTPPFELLLAEVPPDAVRPLVTALRARDVEVPGAHGEVGTVDAFASAWTCGRASTARTAMLQRLYRLDALRPPDPPPGRARLAVVADLSRAVEWYARFQHEASAQSTALEPAVRSAIEQRLLWLWTTPTGQAVSFAARGPTAEGVARVGPVYTPVARRRHGYGTAVTAACTRDALDRGATEVVLFTDLANPTSNAIYQRIGYVPVRDTKLVRFAGGECAALPDSGC